MKRKYLAALIVVLVVAGLYYSYNSEPGQPVKAEATTREKRVVERLNYYYNQVKEKEELLTTNEKIDQALGENYVAKVQVFSEDKIFYVVYARKEGSAVSLRKSFEGTPDVTVSVDEKLIGSDIQKNSLNAETLAALFLAQKIKVTPLTEIPKLVQLARENADEFWLKLSGVQIEDVVA